jgi:hypothetical protein
VASYVREIRGKTGLSWIVGFSNLAGIELGRYLFYGILRSCKCTYKM